MNGLVPFAAVKGKDDSMSSSEPPVTPEESLATPAQAPEKLPPPESAVKFTRTAGLWSFLATGFVILIVLLIFITQNTAAGDFAFLGWHWTLPLGVAILLAAVCGGLITFLAGTARIYQLRRAAKKNLIAGR